jgi:hypothetical protein
MIDVSVQLEVSSTIMIMRHLFAIVYKLLGQAVCACMDVASQTRALCN